MRVIFSGSSLKQDKITYNGGKIVKIYIVYKINKNFNIRSYPALENFLFGAFSLTKNIGFDKYPYSGYRIEFGRHGFFLHPSGGSGRNVIIFGKDMSPSIEIDNWKKYILILDKGSTQGLDHTMSAEKMSSIIFTEKIKKCCLNSHHNGVNSCLFFNAIEIYKYKAKDSEIVASSLCLGNISKG